MVKVWCITMYMAKRGTVLQLLMTSGNLPNMTQGEKDELQFKMALINKLVEVREQKGISQKRLAEMSGLKQAAICRLERMQATPQIDTLFKVLKPLGYTLAIVPDREGH